MGCVAVQEPWVCSVTHLLPTPEGPRQTWDLATGRNSEVPLFVSVLQKRNKVRISLIFLFGMRFKVTCVLNSFYYDLLSAVFSPATECMQAFMATKASVVFCFL
mgnify:CR=1 FL=1